MSGFLAPVVEVLVPAAGAGHSLPAPPASVEQLLWVIATGIGAIVVAVAGNIASNWLLQKRREHQAVTAIQEQAKLKPFVQELVDKSVEEARRSCPPPPDCGELQKRCRGELTTQLAQSIRDNQRTFDLGDRRMDLLTKATLQLIHMITAVCKSSDIPPEQCSSFEQRAHELSQEFALLGSVRNHGGGQ